jgi:hypothetical protein
MWPFKPHVPSIRTVDVRKAAVKVLLADKREFTLEFHGDYLGVNPFGDDDWINDAETVFRSWQERSGKTGMVSIGGGRYIPLCNVSDITVEYSKHEVEVKE